MRRYKRHRDAACTVFRIGSGVRHFFAREESESRLWLAVATSVVGQLLAVALHCGRSCGVGRGLKTGPSQRMQKYDGHPTGGLHLHRFLNRGKICT